MRALLFEVELILDKIYSEKILKASKNSSNLLKNLINFGIRFLPIY